MKSYFHITASSYNYLSDPLWLILQHGAGLIGYTLYAPQNQCIIRSQLWQINIQNSETSERFDNLSKAIGDELNLTKIISINFHAAHIAIPELIHQSGKVNDWIQLLNGQNPEEKITLKTSSASGIVHVQPIDQAFNEWLNQKYQYVDSYSFQEFAYHEKEIDSDKLHITFYDQYIFITLYKQGVIHLCQAYPFKTPEDVLYLLLNITDQFELDIAVLSFIPEGFIDADSSLYKLLEQYFPNIEQPGSLKHHYPEETDHLSPFILRYIDRIITCVS